MNSREIKNLINYAYQHLGLNPLDELYVRNRLLEACFMEEYDEDFFYHKSLIEIQNENYESRNWWNGSSRGMRICISAISKSVDAKYIIPTRISMVYGIIEKIKNN